MGGVKIKVLGNVFQSQRQMVVLHNVLHNTDGQQFGGGHLRIGYLYKIQQFQKKLLALQRGEGSLPLILFLLIFVNVGGDQLGKADGEFIALQRRELFIYGQSELAFPVVIGVQGMPLPLDQTNIVGVIVFPYRAKMQPFKLGFDGDAFVAEMHGVRTDDQDIIFPQMVGHIGIGDKKLTVFHKDQIENADIHPLPVGVARAV